MCDFYARNFDTKKTDQGWVVRGDTHCMIRILDNEHGDIGFEFDRTNAEQLIKHIHRWLYPEKYKDEE